MNRTIIIVIQFIIIIGLVSVLLFWKDKSIPEKPVIESINTPKATKTIKFPDVKLRDKEHIVQAEMQFQSASIHTIRNIPPAWFTNLKLDPPPNPKYVGSIEVGAAALDTTKDLPEFEIARYTNNEEPRAIKAVLMVQEYGGDGKQRKIEINIEKP